MSESKARALAQALRRGTRAIDTPASIDTEALL
jgi:hypothetical protein